ncbi:hypothetical protein ILUMI_12019 [Ignelater luminosus]|uniref:Uncharacterized protein n=1 Tax=Ignelater luminosus TaxID=2038154 RepID=A0A8K0CV05_IGNLU|nr:hypothetical protein ILUMI_12019 [Ignelater luminosus]
MNALSSVITTTADRLTTNEQITEFTRFIEAKKEILEEAAQVGRDAIEQAKENVAWATKYRDVLYEYLKQVVPVTTTTPEPTTTDKATTTAQPTSTKDPNSGTSLTVCSTLLVLSVLKAVFRS